MVVDLFRQLLPHRAKPSPSGWISFNAPCCGHRGHSPDTRKRGGVMLTDSIVFNCFNCKFSAGWAPGSQVNNKLKNLCKWLGASDDHIKQMVFEALKTEAPDYTPIESKHKIEFTEKELPEGSLPLIEWLNASLTPDEEQKLIGVVEYVVSRGYDPSSKHFYWSPVAGYDNRVIIPFTYKGKIVGSTARKVTAGKPKYLSDQHPFFVFNTDEQTEDKKYTLVCEGPFDALSVGGVALLTNEISDQQSRIITSIGNEIIVIPDQDKAGLTVIDQAKELGWGVAFPNWEPDVKDCADAVQRYGKLFVIVDIIKTAIQNPIKIEMAKRNLQTKLELMEKQDV